MTKVVIYNGTGAGQNGPVNTAAILRAAGYQVAYASKLSTELLRGVDALVIPGGDSGRKYLQVINGDVIRQYVKDGGKLFATCAGAYAASKHVDAPYDYDGWGVAPSVKCKAVEYIGDLPVKLKDGKIITLHHYRGPAMYVEQEGAGEALAWYNDDKTGRKSYIAIAGDTYGKGRVVLCGPHPELSPQHPGIIRLIMDYLLKKTNTESGTVSNSMNYKKVEIAEAGKRVKAFMESNKRLPNTVKIAGKDVNISDFLYLMTELITTGASSVTQRTVTIPSSTDKTFNAGTLTQKEYLDVAKRVSDFIEKNGRAPSYASSSLGNVSYLDLIYDFSKIWNFIYINGRNPNTVSCTPFGTYTPAKIGPMQTNLQNRTGIKVKNISEVISKIVLPYGKYCNPMYLDNKKTVKQVENVLVNNVKGITKGEINQINCVDITIYLIALAKEMKEYGVVKYEDIRAWSFRCTSLDINHAVAIISGGEFTGKTVQTREKQYGPIVTVKGSVVDGAAAAESSYPVGRFWCSNTDVRANKEPGWIPYLKY